MKLPIDFETSFLSIATDKNFGSNTEDRLAQIVVATFEHSIGPLREIKSIPIEIRKSIGPRELALQTIKKILPKLKE